MSATAEKPKVRLLLKHESVEYLQTRYNLTGFTEETLKRYSYKTDLLPRPTIIGRRAYWNTADLDDLVAAL